MDKWERLTEFGLKMYQEKYLLPSETVFDLVDRVIRANVTDEDRINRLKSYWQKAWFHPATPVTSNSGTQRGKPISCFVSETSDSKESIFNGYYESMILGSDGGGIGRRWVVRGAGEPIAEVGESSGLMPFLKVSDSASAGISQGALRRSSEAAYIDIDSPEIEEFIEMRKATGGDANRKCFNLHHGVILTDKFINAVINDSDWELISPKDGGVRKTVKAFDLWKKILLARIETGEPYILFKDNANRQLTDLYIKAGYDIHMSNLCSEIMLHTSDEKTNVCCLSSVNLEYYDEWRDDEYFIEDIMYFLDGVLEQFVDKINKSPDYVKLGYRKVLKAVLEERSVGLGTSGFHGYLQKKNVPFESSLASSINDTIFKHIRARVDSANTKIAEELGSCQLAEKFGVKQRFALTMAIAPTSSISIMMGESTAGIDPRLSNAYVHKNDAGSIEVRNPYLVDFIKKYAKDNSKNEKWIKDQWKSIIKNGGSVQHLDWMDSWSKDVFKTAYELDQRWIVEHASMRQPSIDQGQSVNLFLPNDVDKQYLSDLHLLAWKKGLKSLYYCRSTAPKRANIGDSVEREIIQEIDNLDECLSCQ